MARNGRKPSAARAIREYEDTPVKKHGRKKPPTLLQRAADGADIEVPLHPEAIEIFEAAKRLPHTVDWGRAEWSLLRYACYLAHAVYSDPTTPTSKATEMRRTLSTLGYTQDDRSRLGIVYVAPQPQEPAKTTTTTAPDFRKRRRA